MGNTTLGLPATALVGLVRFCTLLVVLAIWVVVGFFFWVPLLARAIAVFSAGMLYTMLAGSREQAERFRLPIDFAAAFYVEGFQRIIATLYPKNEVHATWGPLQLDLKWKRILGEILWAILFWLLLLARQVLPWLYVG